MTTSAAGRSRDGVPSWALAVAASALVTPAVLGALLPDPARTHAPEIWRCPLLHATGVPCPLCGATRAFICLFHGDSSVAHYNWSWIVWWGLGCIAAAVLILRRVRRRPLLGHPAARLVEKMGRRASVTVALALALVAASWLLALANVHWIART